MNLSLTRTKKGFTLIELLIVVVIIAILAALLLPRLLQQPEKAVIAEGLQYLGVIKRAQATYADTAGSGAFLPFNVVGRGGGGAVGSPWRTLGLQPLSATSRFAYTCGAGVPFSCTATRIFGGNFNGSTITMDVATGAVTCGGATGRGARYNPVIDAAGTTVTCSP